MIEIPTEFSVTKGGSEKDISIAEAALGIPLPPDYKQFLSQYDGGEGFVGEHYLVLWSADQLEQFNREYGFPVYAPEFVAFGGDGGGEAFAFDTRSMPYSVVMIPFIGMEAATAIPVATGFLHLIDRMTSEDDLT